MKKAGPVVLSIFGILFMLHGVGWAAGTVFANGVFVTSDGGCMMEYAGDSVCISKDGVNWRRRIYAEAPSINGFAFGNNTFVGVGFNHVITSPDGVNWTKREVGDAGVLENVAFGNNTFVAVSGTRDYGIITSPDGVNWTKRATPSVRNFYGVAFGNNTFVTIGGLDSTIFTSRDGVTWTEREKLGGFGSAPLSVSFVKNTFVIGSDKGSILLTSPDGVNWTKRALLPNIRFNNVIFANNIFVAAADSYGIATSKDGVNWKIVEHDCGFISSVAFGNGTFVALGNKILISKTGATWSLVSEGRLGLP